LDGDRVTYVGEVGGDTKLNLFADARGLLMPILWSEPFGMVMVEALSAGTPVIAFPNGAAPEIVEDAISGYLAADEADMASKIAQLDKIDPAACRKRATRFDIHQIAAAYENAYYTTIDRRRHADTAGSPRRKTEISRAVHTAEPI
ncbi:MAG: glycosyltransferase family 4 protein, partial [Pseudonocardiales bacterium]|nr:glycosyltransferase family 4 protein [Pseudonocardiales bacterium]